MLSDEFREKIREMPEYIRYQEKERELLRIPGMKADIDEFRKQLFALYDTGDCHDLIARTRVLEEKYEELLKTPEAAAYLRAEAVYLRKVRIFLESGARAADVRIPL